VLDKLVTALEQWSTLQADIVRSSPIVSICDNYDRLYYEQEATARGSRYSHYVDEDHVLRTHTTSAIPGLLSATTADRLMVVPGLVYRRDVVDKMHCGEPHQVDLWIVRKARLRRADLKDMIAVIMESLLPGLTYRCNETIHPYTMNGLEVEVRHNDRWVEVLECGEAHPWLLNDCGLPSQEWSGLAMGIGLDRMVMLLKGMDDIRLLRSPDPRVARQMASLGPYEAVSSQPAAKRDMSVAVDDPNLEILGARIREALGDRADWIEDIVIISNDSYRRVPPPARVRLGMLPHQNNVLLRMIMRSPTESIPREVANEVYDAVYAALHDGVQIGYARAS
jgi:phenylalanyl-tRNA synthetase alpha chain